jgi:hypothetical protein
MVKNIKKEKKFLYLNDFLEIGYAYNIVNNTQKNVPTTHVKIVTP